MPTETERKELSITDSMMKIAIAMSEGNPGAMRVILDLMGQDDKGALDVLSLDDMNIRGTQVWAAFKDFAGEDMATFREAITTRDPAMVEAVNAEGRAGNHTAMAVQHGASYPGGRKSL